MKSKIAHLNLSMMKPITNQTASTATAVIVGSVVTTIWFLLTWRYGLDLADEGYYWYGSQRVLQGDVPIRDFLAYDIGRYYWAAKVMHLVGEDGIWSARLSAVIFQLVGVIVGVYHCIKSTSGRFISGWLYALLASFILNIWMFPYYKVYDHTTTIILLASMVALLKYQTPRIWFLSGVCLGLAAIIGRNHGAYGIVASIIIISYLMAKEPKPEKLPRLVTYFSFGILVGFSPTLWMWFNIDGFFIAFLDSIAAMFKYGSTNIKLPIPWPWSTYAPNAGLITNIKLFTIGLYFILLILAPIFFLFLLKSNISRDRHTSIVVIAALATAVPYVHYSFSRADSVHLALGIFPILIGLLTIFNSLSAVKKMVLGAVMLITSLLALVDSQPYLAFKLLQRPYVTQRISNENIYIKPALSKKIDFITKQLSATNIGNRNFLAIPDMPGIHAIFHEKIVLWEIYALIPRDLTFELSEIHALNENRPKLIFLSNHALDDNLEFRYSQLHPAIFHWIIENYKPIDKSSKATPLDFTIYSLQK